jgi:hypothetical protein
MDAIKTTLLQFYKKNTYTITHLSSSKTYAEMDDDEKAEVRRLKKRDAEVKAHEEAHRRAAGSLVRGRVHYKYKIGPDGNRYAVAGDVRIDVSEDQRGPEKTIEKAEIIKRAASAPAKMSPSDRQVAADAERMKQKAKQEIEQEKKEKRKISDLNYNPYKRMNNLPEIYSTFDKLI